MPDASGEPRGSTTVLAVTLKREREQIAEIVRILGDLDIVTDGLSTGGPDGAGPLLVRIPPGRVLEAVLCLNYHGFPEVRVYAPDAPGDAR